MDFVGAGFSAHDCVVEVTAISCLIWSNSTVSLCKCMFYTKRCCPCSASCSFCGSPWEYLQKEMQAVDEANMKYMTYFGHMFTQWFMLRHGPSIWISKQNIIQKKSFLEHFSEVNCDLSVQDPKGAGRCCSTCCHVWWLGWIWEKHFLWHLLKYTRVQQLKRFLQCHNVKNWGFVAWDHLGLLCF